MTNSPRFTLVAIMFLSLSCSKPLSKKDQIYKEVDKLLEYCREENEKAVYNMAFDADYPNNITDPEKRIGMVRKYRDFIKSFGIPPHDKWLLEKTPLNYQVHIPISNYHDTTTAIKNVQLVIYYTPPQIANRIYNFNFTSEIDFSKLKPTIPPVTPGNNSK
jgi:hypothetical protein